MSNDRHPDERVSAAYKELASERTPRHLDQRVLAMAADAAKKPLYSRWMAWSRPVAWAATITLCLAITLELVRDPAVDVAVEANSPASAPTVNEYQRGNDAAVEKDLANRPGVASEVFVPENREANRNKISAKEEIGLSMKTAPVRARAQDAQLMSGAAMSDEAAISDELATYDSACPAAVRAVASDWLACILELEAAGREDASASERELLIDTFPDFKLP